MNSKFRRKSGSINDTRIAGLYDLEHTIGKGHFAVVKLARHVFTGEKVAVKVIDKTKMQEDTRKYMMQEVRCMKLVQHPNIVRLYEVIDTQTKLFLILELGDYDMYDYIMKNLDKGCKESDAQQYFSQIIKAIDYCHTLHVVHRDLKLENVVFFEKLGMVKLTDFGFSNLYTPGQQLNTSCGSLAYSAPEILLGDAYDPTAVDIWSLGVILYMLVCGRLPFQEANESETLTKILDCRFTLPDHLSTPCKHLISRILVRDPKKRATISEIIQSSWVIAGDRGIAEVLPLIVKDHLPDSAHSTIIEQMIAGGIGEEEEILKAIENDDYSYITATYYLLAERVLASYREEQANRLLCAIQTPSDDKEIFDNEHNFSCTATVSGGFQTRSRSNSWRGASSKRAFTILKEESEEELSSYLRSSSRQSSRFFKETIPIIRREHSQSSRLTMGSRASSSDSCFAAPCPILEVTDDKENADEIDELSTSPPYTLNILGTAHEHRAFNHLPSFSFDELSPIHEYDSAASFSQTFVEHAQDVLDSNFSESESKPRFTIDSVSSQSSTGQKIDEIFEAIGISPKRNRLKLMQSLELPEWEPFTKPDSICHLPRTPSAPMTISSIVKKRLRRTQLLRRNSSPSVSMFGGLHSSRDRISPQAIQELLEFSRTSGIRRAASPDSRFSSRSPSPPTSSGRTSPAFSGIVSGIARLKSSMITSTSGMRKLSSSPHLLGICEESEDLTDSNASPFYANTSKSGFQKSSPSSKGHLTRNNRSASTGFPSSVTARLQKMSTITNNDVFDNPSTSTAASSRSNSITSLQTYGSARVVRPRQAVVSPDMCRRYEQHQRFVTRSRKSTSCSSSETSDDDTNERKWSLIGSKYCKRNPDDPKPDEDPPKGGTGGGNFHGSLSVKMTIPESETNGNHEQESTTNADNSNNGTKSNKNGNMNRWDSLELLDSCSTYGRYSGVLQPILEHPPDSLLYDRAAFIRCRMFNKSETAREALHDWLQESQVFNDYEVEEYDNYRDKFVNSSPPKFGHMKRASLNPSASSPFYRSLTRSRSLDSTFRSMHDSISNGSRSLMDSRSDSICLDLSDKEDMQISMISDSSSTTIDSGCSSDDEPDQTGITIKFPMNYSPFSLKKPKIDFQENIYKVCQ